MPLHITTALKLLRVAEKLVKPSTWPELKKAIEALPADAKLDLRVGRSPMGEPVVYWRAHINKALVVAFLNKLGFCAAKHGWYILKVRAGKPPYASSAILEAKGPGTLVKPRPKMLWHATPTATTPLILKKGLVPQPNRFVKRNTPHRVYAATTREAAIRHARMCLENAPKHGSAYDVFEIDVSKIRGVPFYKDREQPDTAVWTDHTIPITALRKLDEQVRGEVLVKKRGH